MNDSWSRTRGPLIALATIGRFSFLRELAAEVLVPRGVQAEVLGGAPRPGAREVADATWIRVVDVPGELVAAFRLVVDQGEAEALAVSRAYPDALLVVDDQRARRIAKELGLRLTGTLGILDLAKRDGLIPSVRPEVARLRESGFRIDDALVNAFFLRIGE